jgi:hypothetical protein
MDLCKYSNIFGKPNTGLHAIRIFDSAIIDIIFVFLGAYIAHYYINKYFNTNTKYIVYLIELFILGIIMHRLFCVRTTIDKYLFSE